ncbi:MAG: DUF1330 domain-containing protein [Pseudomonadota bacterium]
MAKGYWVGRVTVNQPDRYHEYVEAATPAYKEHGAVFLVRGGEFEEMEGGSRERNVVIEFPTYEAALACYNSETYQKAKAIRNQIADADMIVIKGHEA